MPLVISLGRAYTLLTASYMSLQHCLHGHCIVFQNGQTPLLLAAEKGHFGIVRELLHRNASVNARDEVKRNLFHLQFFTIVYWFSSRYFKLALVLYVPIRIRISYRLLLQLAFLP